MARERRRRGWRQPRQPEAGPPPRPKGERREPLEVREESQAPGVLPGRLVFWRRRPQGQRQRRPKREERRVTTSTRTVSPLAFWRRGRPRPYREAPLPKRTPGRLWRRFTGFYFPPWVPVAVVIVAVFAILGGVFFIRGTTAAPRIGDHWHAAYAVFICGQRQPTLPEIQPHIPEGIHTHGDGIIHLHPSLPAGEGSGAAVGKWFGYEGGELGGSLRMPGEDKEWKNGDLCPDGQPGVLRILRLDSGIHPVLSFNQLIQSCNERPNSAFQEVNRRYIPKDGDCLRIIFGPEEFEPTPIPTEELTPVPEPYLTPTPTPTATAE